MTLSVFIDGAAGTTGIEIAERLAGRPELALCHLTDAERKDERARRVALNDCDVAILCLPDAAAIEAVHMIANDRTRVIDASTAHRIDPEWTYGFAEFTHGQRERIAAARRVTNPGCYPTGFLALVAPLVFGGLLPADHAYLVNAVSGYSGGGKPLIERMHADPALAHRAYGLDLEHKHVPEMQMHADLFAAPLFAPSVSRAYRGMIVEVPLAVDAIGAPPPSALREALAAHYADEALVTVHDEVPAELLLRDDAAATDRIDLYVASNRDGSLVRLIALLDNLGKGASGAAVQNLNLMAGLPEHTGLRL